jgi:hypothetical protein
MADLPKAARKLRALVKELVPELTVVFTSKRVVVTNEHGERLTIDRRDDGWRFECTFAAGTDHGWLTDDATLARELCIMAGLSHETARTATADPVAYLRQRAIDQAEDTEVVGRVEHHHAVHTADAAEKKRQRRRGDVD